VAVIENAPHGMEALARVVEQVQQLREFADGRSLPPAGASRRVRTALKGKGSQVIG
jgi:hypothetical protein